MPRIPIAVIGGLAFFFGYIALVVIIADWVLNWYWSLQIVYFALAGAAWVPVIRWIMLWSVRKR